MGEGCEGARSLDSFASGVSVSSRDFCRRRIDRDHDVVLRAREAADPDASLDFHVPVRVRNRLAGLRGRDVNLGLTEPAAGAGDVAALHDAGLEDPHAHAPALVPIGMVAFETAPADFVQEHAGVFELAAVHGNHRVARVLRPSAARRVSRLRARSARRCRSPAGRRRRRGPSCSPRPSRASGARAAREQREKPRKARASVHQQGAQPATRRGCGNSESGGIAPDYRRRGRPRGSFFSRPVHAPPFKARGLPLRRVRRGFERLDSRMRHGLCDTASLLDTAILFGWLA